MNQLATDGIAPGQDESDYFTRVFAWMAAGLAVTGGVAAAVYSSGTALHAFEGSSGPTIFIILAILELALVAGLVGLVQHMSLFEARATFLAYAVLNGVTFSVIFLAYTTSSIVSTFLVTAAMFGALALWGYTTKADLTGMAQLPLHGADRSADRARRQPFLAEQHAEKDAIIGALALHLDFVNLFLYLLRILGKAKR